MFKLRDQFPVLRDGFFLQQLSNQTKNIYLPGSNGVATETGMWSVLRTGFQGVQNFTGTDQGTQDVWLLYSNLNESKTWDFNCRDNQTDLNSTALIAPFTAGTTVKNLFYPFDERKLGPSTQSLQDTSQPNGCLDSLFMKSYDYRAYVPIDDWVGPQPMITRFSPGHDARILSKGSADQAEEMEVELQFSSDMDCDSVTNSISFTSSTNAGVAPKVNLSTVDCGRPKQAENTTLVGGIQSVWAWSAKLVDVAHGIHALTVNDASAADGKSSTKAKDRFLFRLGERNNPIVFTRSANYSTTLLTTTEHGKLLLNHSAPGADMYRYSTNFASSFSDWKAYIGGTHEIEKQPWSGTELQAWIGEHVRVEYFSKLAGSSDHVQQADLDVEYQRRFPHIFLNGPYNAYGYDAGLNNEMKLVGDNQWSLDWMVEWNEKGSLAQANVWGINPDGNPDKTYVMGDADGDSILDRMPPSALAATVLNVTLPPPLPHLSWRFILNDGSMRFQLLPAGSMWLQIAIYVLLWVLPIALATLSAWTFAQSFYKVQFNKVGITIKRSWIPFAIKRPFKKINDQDEKINWGDTAEHESVMMKIMRQSQMLLHLGGAGLQLPDQQRRTVLIATMEYHIEDWNIKIKIGGLGVMSGLMVSFTSVLYLGAMA
jgi:alpha-1,3-glucan synthase